MFFSSFSQQQQERRIAGEIPTVGNQVKRMNNTENTQGERGKDTRRLGKMTRKWFQNWQRIETMRDSLENYKQDGVRGLSNMRAGPPNYLKADAQGKWRATIVEAIRQCTEIYWIPQQKEDLVERWIGLRKMLIDNIDQCGRKGEESRGIEGLKAIAGEIEKILKGIRGKERKSIWIPPPPKVKEATLRVDKLEKREELDRVDVEHIETLKRGEVVTPVNRRYTISQKIGYNRDQSIIIGWAVYGCRNRQNFIYRSILKYMDNREQLRIGFVGRSMTMKNGKSRMINNYKQYRYVLYTQKSRLGREELEIISIVYQVQIRIFREGNNCKESNVICIDQVGYNYGRMVNLIIRRGEWALLQNELRRGEGEKENITEKETQKREEGVVRGDRVESKQDRTEVGTLQSLDKTERREESLDYNNRIGEGREEVKRKYSRREKTQKEEEEIDMGIDNLEDVDQRKGARIRGVRTPRSVNSSIELIDREKLEVCWLQKLVEERKDEREDINRIDRDKNGDIIRMGVNSETSSIDGIDREKLEEVSVHNNKIGGVREEKSEDSKNERTQQGEEGSDREINELEDIDSNMGTRIGGGYTPRSENSSIELIDRKKLEEWLEREYKAVEGGGEDREDSKRDKAQKDEHGVNREIEYRVDREGNKGGRKKGESVGSSEISTIELIDRKKLDKCVEQYIKVGEGGEDERRGEKAQKEREVLNMQVDNLGDRSSNRRVRARGGSIVAVDSSSIDLTDREKVGECLEQESRIGKKLEEWLEWVYKSVEGGGKDREDSIRDKAQKDEQGLNREIEYRVDRESNRRRRKRGGSVGSSESSIIELIDREKLDKCVEQYIKAGEGGEDERRGEKPQKERGVLNMQLDNLVDRSSNRRARVRGGSIVAVDSRNIGLTDREKVGECVEQERRTGEEREDEEREDIKRDKPRSSAEVLFRDRQSEEEGIRLRNKEITGSKLREGREGASVANVEISSKLIQRKKLEEYLAYNNRTGREREVKNRKREDSGSEQTQQEEEKVDRELDNQEDTGNNKRGRIRGGSTPRLESSSIEFRDRKKFKECLEQKDKSVVEGGEDSEDSRRDKAQEDKQEAHREIENQVDRDSNKGGRKRGGSVVSSECSIIELIDREKLEKCVEQYIKTGGEMSGDDESRVVSEREKTQKDKEALNIELDNQVDRNSTRGGSVATSDSSNIELIDREKLEECLEQKSRVREERKDEEREEMLSEKTTSSIEALFRDRQLEKEGKRVGNKGITRRKVWERWKGVVRGMIRRSIKKKKKIEREIEKEKETNRLVFDYTTHKLSVEEMQLLGRGEAFCVVDHKIDEDRSKVDIYHFQRRLRLHELFRDPGSKEEEERVEATYTPARRRTYRTGEMGDSRLRTDRRGSRDGAIGIERRGGMNIRGNSRGRERGSGRVSRMSTNRAESETFRVEEERRRESENRVATVDRRGGRRSSIVRGSVRRRESRRSYIGQNEVERVEEGGGNIEYKETGRRLPSIYDPDSHNRNLNRYNTCIQEEIMLSIEKKVEFRDNISKAERKALKLLKSRIEEKEIIITRADKGSGLVAVDYDRYINKGTKYIEEEAGAYTRVQETEKDIIDRLSKQRNKIAELLKDRGVISVQTATYIKKQLEQKITGIKFYYKIHKDRNIETMPLRPLQSCIKAPTQHLSIVLTDILQTLLTDKNIPSFIFDSNQLLYRLRNLGNIPDSCTIISSDVSALYPSIPHREGFRAIKGFLEEKTNYNTGQIESIIIALELVITENFMIWNKQIYKQTSGVAMGTPVAVAYANIFMNWVDKEVRQRAPYIYEHIRFIDDNLFILPEDRVESLIEIANNILPPYIKFTYEKLDKESDKGLPFLDTQLFISKEKTIESRLYTKKTDRHAYLLPSSYHPPHITKNIPMAVFGRIRKICSKEEWYREDAKLAEGWLANRGYERREIQRAVEKTSRKDRWEMIEQIEKNRNKSLQKEEGEVVQIPFIMTFNQHGREIKKILKDRQPLLDSAFRRTKVRPRLSYRRRRNLNDVVVQKGLRGPLEDNRKGLNIFSECGEKPGYRNRCPCKGKHNHEKCRRCIHNRGKIEGVEGNIHKPVNCNSKNVVYVIGCRECNKKYIGETQQRLKDRLAQHMYNMDKLNQPVYLHFRYVHKLENLYISIVETVRGEEPFLRKVREAWWINHLKTLEPSGFNVKLECNQIYEATS